MPKDPNIEESMSAIAHLREKKAIELEEARKLFSGTPLPSKQHEREDNTVRVSSGIKEGVPLVTIHFGEKDYVMSAHDAAQLAGVIQASVAAVWSVITWQQLQKQSLPVVQQESEGQGIHPVK